MTIESRLLNIESKLGVNTPKVWFVMDDKNDIPIYQDPKTKEKIIWNDSMAGKNDILIHYTNHKKNAEDN